MKKIGLILFIIVIILIMTRHMDIPIANSQTPPEDTRMTIDEGEGNFLNYHCSLYEYPYKVTKQMTIDIEGSCKKN